MGDDLGPVLVVGLVMAVGLAGVLLPFIPGLPLIWAGAFLYGVMEGFGGTGVVAMIVITAIMVAGITSKLLVPKRRATASGAPRSTLVVGLILGVVGFFVVPIVGLPLGAALGVLLAERRRTDDWDAARRSTKEVIVGFGIGALLELAAGIAMIVTWVAWVLIHN